MSGHVKKDGTWYVWLHHLRTHSSTSIDRLLESVGDDSDPILAVDRLDLERVHPPESPDERYQRVERIHFATAEELERIRPRSCTSCARSVSGEDMRRGVCGDCRRKRGEVEATAMSASEAKKLGHLLCDWMDENLTDNPTAAETTLTATLSDLIMTGKLSHDGFVVATSTSPVTPALTNAEWAALEAASEHAAEEKRHHGFVPGGYEDTLISAVHKLRTQARSPLAAGKLGDDRRGAGR